ncbi:MAG: ImmA/IrrE family metallo-endopeptidase [Chitinophagaceae bacterium]
MKTSSNSSTTTEIEKYVYDILKQSKSFDIFPTPVEKIVHFAELNIDKQHGLHNIPNHYISKKMDALISALKKVYGALDRREKIIYLNPTLNNGKKSFVQLHEVGHHVLPWQREVFEFLENDESLSPDVEEKFEAEANNFASHALFQLGRFEREISSLPLSLATIRHLSAKFGASLQATFRRYVERSPKRVGLLVLNKPDHYGDSLGLRNWIMSSRFACTYPGIEFPELFSKKWAFVRAYYSNRRYVDTPHPLNVTIESEEVKLEYRYFDNKHNIFVLITPSGEKISSRARIITPW